MQLLLLYILFAYWMSILWWDVIIQWFDIEASAICTHLNKDWLKELKMYYKELSRRDQTSLLVLTAQSPNTKSMLDHPSTSQVI